MRKIIALVLPLLCLSLLAVQVQAPAIVVHNDPPYFLVELILVWGDADTELVIAVFLMDAMEDGIVMWLSEQAHLFLPPSNWPDHISLRGDEVPVVVWGGTLDEILEALSKDDWDFLDSRLVAEGEVRFKWTAKRGKMFLLSAHGRVNLAADDSSAILTAFDKCSWNAAGELRNENSKISLHHP